MFGNDGLVYKETLTKYTNFTYTTKIDLEGIIEETIQPILAEKQLLNYYLTNFPKTIASDLGASWVQTTKGTNLTTGHFQDVDSTRFQVGSFTGSSLRFLEEGTLIKFLPPAGYHFMKDGTLMAGAANHPDSFDYKWVKVVSIVGDGAVDNTDGSGPIILNDVIPSTAV